MRKLLSVSGFTKWTRNDTEIILVKVCVCERKRDKVHIDINRSVVVVADV